MAGDMTRRRELAARAFAERRRELGLTQEQVAQRGGLVVRTVQNFESGRWPNRLSRDRLEQAVEWPQGHIERLSEPPQADGDGSLHAALDRLQEQIDWLRAEVQRREQRGDGHDRAGLQAL